MKEARNTLKFFQSESHDDGKGRTKSTGKLRKNKQPPKE